MKGVATHLPLVSRGVLRKVGLHLLKEVVERHLGHDLLARLANLGLLGCEVDRRRLVRLQVGSERGRERGGGLRRGRGGEGLDGREGGGLGL